MLCRSRQWFFTAYEGVPLTDNQKIILSRMGANIRRERVAQNLTQEKLAELADLNLRTLQKIESGNLNILITTVEKIRVMRKLGSGSNS